MNILGTVGIMLPCHSCGNTYQVPLRDVLLSHTILHEGCPARQETECPPVFQSRLFERKDIEELQRTWNQMEQRARADGGELVLMAAGASGETQPTGRGKASPGLRQAVRGSYSDHTSIRTCSGACRQAIRKNQAGKKSQANAFESENRKKQEDCLTGRGSTTGSGEGDRT